MSTGQLTVVCLGDIVGRTGRQAIKEWVPRLRKELNPDLVIANGENAAGGIGLDTECAKEIRECGVDLITLGDHTWNKRDLHDYLNKHVDSCIRPANYPVGAPGRGWAIWQRRSDGLKVGVMNLIGRIFMNTPLDCPFRKADEIVDNALRDCAIKICDLHAEATSEKIAMGRYMDGRISLLYGTHTHVQTADNQLFAGGTAFISDIGMCGGANGVIGMDATVAVERFLSGLPHSYQVAGGEKMINGIVCKIEIGSGKAVSIERILRRDSN